MWKMIYLGPLVETRESAALLVPDVTLLLLLNEEDEAEEETSEGKSLAVKILAWGGVKVGWGLGGRGERLNPRPNWRWESSGHEESSEERTKLSSLDTVDVEEPCICIMVYGVDEEINWGRGWVGDEFGAKVLCFLWLRERKGRDCDEGWERDRKG